MLEAINIEEVSERDLSPQVIYTIHSKDHSNEIIECPERYVYSYEFVLIKSNQSTHIINGKKLTLKMNDILIRRPGELNKTIGCKGNYLILVELLGKSRNKVDSLALKKFQPICKNHIVDTLPTVFTPNKPEKYERIFEAIYDEFMHDSIASPLILKSLVLQLIFYIYNETLQTLKEVTTLQENYRKNLIDDCIEYIKRNLDQNIKLSDIAKVANMSPNHFHTIFKKMTGRTPTDYLRYERLSKAKYLLYKTDLPIMDISLICGFNSAAYFTHVFKHHYDIIPKEYRKLHSIYM